MIAQFWGVSQRIIPGIVTPADIETVPGCQGIYLELRNLKDLSQYLHEKYQYFMETKDSPGFLKVIATVIDIVNERKRLAAEIDKIKSQL